MSIHFTCDVCGKTLPAEGRETRYVVKVEIYSAYDPLDITDEDLSHDHSDEIEDLLDEMADIEAEALENQVYKTFRYDLCPECQAVYLKDPLMRQARQRARFGHN